MIAVRAGVVIGLVASIVACGGDPQPTPAPIQKPTDAAVPTPDASMAPPAVTHAASSDELTTEREPTADEVVRLIAVHYKDPSKLVATPKRDRKLVIWELVYDGIAMKTDARTSSRDGKFITRFIEQLDGPAPIDRGRLLDKAAALAAARRTGDATLTWFPRFKQVQTPGTKGDNATDWHRLIDGFDLKWVIDDRDDQAQVDAYSGAVQTFSKWID